MAHFAAPRSLDSAPTRAVQVRRRFFQKNKHLIGVIGRAAALSGALTLSARSQQPKSGACAATTEPQLKVPLPPDILLFYEQDSLDILQTASTGNVPRAAARAGVSAVRGAQVLLRHVEGSALEEALVAGALKALKDSLAAEAREAARRAAKAGSGVTAGPAAAAAEGADECCCALRRLKKAVAGAVTSMESRVQDRTLKDARHQLLQGLTAALDAVEVGLVAGRARTLLESPAWQHPFGCWAAAQAQSSRQTLHRPCAILLNQPWDLQPS
jgi:hypothetical protein